MEAQGTVQEGVTVGDTCSALSVLKAAVEQDPANVANWLLYGTSLLENGWPEEAVKVLEKALALNPNTFDTRYYLGCALAQAGRHEEAIRHFWSLCGDDAQLHNPLSATGVSALMGMAESQGELGHWSEAVSTVLPAVTLAIDILGHFAGFVQKTGEYDRAAYLYSVCLLLSPNDPDLLHGAGYNKMRIGHLNGALEDLERALKLDPKSSSTWYDFGNTLSRMGRREEARPIFRKVLRLDPDFFWAHYDLACLDALERNSDAAFRNLNRAVDCGFRDAAYLGNDTDFVAIRDDPRWEAVLRRIANDAGCAPAQTIALSSARGRTNRGCRKKRDLPSSAVQ
jgi:Flp pilus assembly protein TadD